MATQAAKDPSQDEEFLSQLYKGGELLAAGKVVEAKDHLERAFKLHPKNEKAQNLLGLTYFKLGLFDRAAEIYELLVRENPADPTLRVNLGLVYLKTNNLPRATKEFETSTDLDPGHKKAHNYLGLALAQAGDYARAREHFVIAGSDAMAEKMGRAIAAGAPAPAAVAVAPPPSAPKPPPLPPPEEVLERHMTPSPKPTVPSFDVLTMPETSAADVLLVTSDDDVPPDSEVIPAEQLLKPKASPSAMVSSPGAVELAEAAASSSHTAPLPLAGYEEVPPPSPSSPVGKAMRNDWGAQFGMDAGEAPAPAQGGDDMRFAEDEGPPAMPMADEGVATSEAAVATGAQVPVEVVERAQAEQWDAMPMVEATAEEMMVEVDVPISAPSAARAADVALTVTAEAAEAEMPAPMAEAPEMPPGLTFTGEPPTVDVPMAEQPVELAQPEAVADASSAPVEMFPSGGAADDAFATQEAWPEELPPAQSQEDTPQWLTDGQAPAELPQEPVPEYSPQEQMPQEEYPPEQYAQSGEFAEPIDAGDGYTQQDQQFAAEAQAPVEAYAQQPQDEGQVPITGEVPTDPADMAVAQQQGYAQMHAPRLEEIGPSSTMGTGEMVGPFNLSADGLAMSVNGELLMRMPGLLAVVGSIDATPEFRRSRGRTTEVPFGEAEFQLQRVKGNGVVHLDPGGSVYQAIDLADEGAYVREERVFAFEEAVAFENARLTGVGNIGVDVVHLKGQGKVLLKLEGALRAMAIPPGTPLKVPLARLVGWYGYVSVRVMGFVGQGAVELTGDGYVLLAA